MNREQGTVVAPIVIGVICWLLSLLLLLLLRGRLNILIHCDWHCSVITGCNESTVTYEIRGFAN